MAAYCRVSTDKSDQANSFEAQVRFFEGYISHHAGWSLCGIFSDEGITGTSTRRREGFNRMIRAAEAGEIDLIITKEISRFARNTLDSIYYTRALRRLGVGVIFLADGISTLDADGELRLTIMASIAQEESRRTSERVKWGQRRQMERGVVFGRNLLGYKVTDGRLEIDRDGAETVRLIFRMYTEDRMGMHAIAKRLNEMGISTSGGGTEWRSSAVARILKNEKYCGDLIQQKTYTPDFLSHEKCMNRGELEFVCIKDHHDAIIPRNVFERAQELISRRGGKGAGGGARFALSGKVKCGKCGAGYTSKFKQNKSGGYRLWRCSGKCGNGSIRDSILREKIAGALNSMDIDRSGMVRAVRSALEKSGADVAAEEILSLTSPPLSDAVIRRGTERVTVTDGEVKVEFAGGE